jgi:hypothetical protein
MPDLSAFSSLALAVAVVVTAVAAIIQGAIGLGFAVLSVPVLSLVDPRLAPVPQLLLTVPLTFYMAWRERHAIRLKSAAWVLVGRIPGAFLGAALLAAGTARTLDLIIGLVVLFGTIVFSTDITVRRTVTTELAVGIVSGASGVISAIGGPPVALLYRDDHGESLRANLALIFAVGIVISIIARIAGGQISALDLVLTAILFPPLALGLYLSRRLTKYFEGRALKIAVLIICACAALGLIARALF